MTKKASEITFGIEIECNIPDAYSDNFPVGGYHNGIQSPVLPEGWNTQADGSLRSERGFFTAEITSPVLKGEAGLAEVVYVVDLLNSIGAKTNSSCGIHVTVGSRGMDELQKVIMVGNYKLVEEVLFGLNGEKMSARKGSRYCLPYMFWNNSRYCSVNMTHFHKANSRVEYRIWASVLDVEYIIGIIHLAVFMVWSGFNNVMLPVDSRDNAKSVLATICRILKNTQDSLIVDDLLPADIFRSMVKQIMIAR